MGRLLSRVGLIYQGAWSRGIYHILGLDQINISPSEDLFLSFVHPSDRTRDLRDALVSGRPADPIVFRLVRHGGQVALVLLYRIDLDRDEAGGPLCLLKLDLTGRDTFHGMGEPSLAELAGARGLGFWAVVDDARGTVECSPRTLEILGLEGRERVSIADITTSTESADRARAAELLGAGTRDNRPATAEIGYRRASDATQRRLELTVLSPFVRTTGSVVRLGTIEDSTAAFLRRRQGERDGAVQHALSVSRRDAVIVLDAHDVIEQASGPLQDRLGSVPAPGTRGSDALPPGLRAEILDTREAGQAVRVCRHWSKDKARHIKIVICPVDERTVLILPDESELEATKAALRDLEEVWRQRCAAARTFVVDGHEGTGGQLRFGPPDHAERFAFSRHFRAGIPPPELARLDALLSGDRPDGAVVMPFSTTGDNGPTACLLRGYISTAAGGTIRFIGLASESPDLPRRADAAPAIKTAEIGLAPEQMRAARGALNWSVRLLSEKSGVSVATINRLESEVKTVSARGTSIEAIWRAFVAAGIHFTTIDGNLAIVIRSGS